MNRSMDEIIKANDRQKTSVGSTFGKIAADVVEKTKDSLWALGTIGLFVIYPLAMSILEDRFMGKYSKPAQRQ